MGRVREEVGHRKRCPDCWYPLMRVKRSGPLHCPNPDCPVIAVTYATGKPHNMIVRVTRAAVARKKGL